MRCVQITYMYRDASNYKYHSRETLPTALADDEISKALEVLRNCPSEDEFVPEDVGLRSLVDEDPNEDDHCLHEIEFDDMRLCATKVPPTMDISFEDFVARFISLDASNGWNFYDPSPDDDGLCAEYEGPGWIPPTEEERDALRQAMRSPGPAM